MRRSGSNKKLIKLVDIGVPNLWGHLKGGALKPCDEVCGKKRGRRKGHTWRLNEEVKEAVSRKKDAHMVMCQNSTEANKRRYKNMNNKAMKAVLMAMRRLKKCFLNKKWPNWDA